MDNKQKVRKFKININDDNVYDDYCVDDEKEVILQDSLFDRIKNLADLTPIKQKLCFNFVKEDSTVDIDKEEFLTAYSNTVKVKTIIKKHEINRCFISGLTFLLIAIALIFVDVYLSHNFTGVFAYLIEISAWVFAWVAVEVLSIQLLQLTIDKNKLKRLLKAEIIL